MRVLEIVMHKFLLLKLKVYSFKLDVYAGSVSEIPSYSQVIFKFFDYPDFKRFIRGECHGCATDKSGMPLLDGMRLLQGFYPDDVCARESVRYELPVDKIGDFELVSSYHAPLLINWPWLSEEVRQELYKIKQEAL